MDTQIIDIKLDWKDNWENFLSSLQSKGISPELNLIKENVGHLFINREPNYKIFFSEHSESSEKVDNKQIGFFLCPLKKFKINDDSQCFPYEPLINYDTMRDSIPNDVIQEDIINNLLLENLIFGYATCGFLESENRNSYNTNNEMKGILELFWFLHCFRPFIDEKLPKIHSDLYK